MSQEDAGRYKCTAQHELKTLNTYVDVKVLKKPEIMNTSGCVYQSEVLTCVCISQGSPLPTVTWSLLENHTEYSVVTMVTGRTVNSTFVLRVKDHNRTEVQCVSSNRVGQVQESFSPTIRTDTTEPEDPPEKIIQAATSLQLIIAFVVGFVLSALLCYVLIRCHRGVHQLFRRKQESGTKDGDITETLEMGNSQEDSVLNGHAAEVATANTEPGEIYYASIDFSLLKVNGQRHREKKEETEYAEIKREIIEEEEMKESVPEEEPEEEMALYSNVKEIMADE